MGLVASVEAAPSPNDVFGRGIQAFGSAASDYIHNRGVIGIIEDVAMVGGALIGSEFFIAGELLATIEGSIGALEGILMAESAADMAIAIGNSGIIQGIGAARTGYANLSTAWSVANSLDQAFNVEILNSNASSGNPTFNSHVYDSSQNTTNPFNQYTQTEEKMDIDNLVSYGQSKAKDLISVNLQRTGIPTTTQGAANIYSSYSGYPVTSFGTPESSTITPIKRTISDISSTVNAVTNLLVAEAKR